jgi:hypothetical protein
MSELQDTLLIALLTGLFTLSGISIGAFLEHRREKWQYDREKEKRQKEMEEENKRSYLSPLCFYLTKSLFVPVPSSIATFTELKKELVDLGKLKNTIEAVENLMKNNMHILPMDLNLSLIYYVSTFRMFLTSLEETSQLIHETKEGGKRVPKGFLEGLAKLEKIYDSMATDLSGSIYAIMKFNILPTKAPFDVKEKTAEVQAVTEAMKASVVPELKKDGDTK